MRPSPASMNPDLGKAVVGPCQGTALAFTTFRKPKGSRRVRQMFLVAVECISKMRSSLSHPVRKRGSSHGRLFQHPRSQGGGTWHRYFWVVISRRRPATRPERPYRLRQRTAQQPREGQRERSLRHPSRQVHVAPDRIDSLGWSQTRRRCRALRPGPDSGADDHAHVRTGSN